VQLLSPVDENEVKVKVKIKVKVEYYNAISTIISTLDNNNQLTPPARNI